MTEEQRARFANLVVEMLAGDLDADGRELLRSMLKEHPELEVELEESRSLRAALEEGLERPEPPEGFARRVRAHLDSGDPPA